MPATDRPPRRDQEPSGSGMTAAALTIACCARPALAATGALSRRCHPDGGRYHRRP